MTKYHVDGFDVDSLSLYLGVICLILASMLCIRKYSDTDFSNVPSVVGYSVPNNIECPDCGAQIIIDYPDSDSDCDSD